MSANAYSFNKPLAEMPGVFCCAKLASRGLKNKEN